MMNLLFKARSHYFMVLLLTLGSISCASKTPTQVDSYIGLYEVTERACDVPDIAKDECNKTRFIELVKGQFFGVKNNEVALVMWRGDKGEELLYQARVLDSISKNKSVSDIVYISNTDSEKESLILVNGVVTQYKFEMTRADKKVPNNNKIYYTLKPVKRGLLPDYRMNYPGND